MSGGALGGDLANAYIVLQASTVEDTAVGDTAVGDTAVCAATRILGPTDATVGSVGVTGPAHGSSPPGTSLCAGGRASGISATLSRRAALRTH
ncbi:hypothetical protein ACFVTY_03900 [Streptomyces sp. NPDC058067]|uniref:hypothetical protein n=1 Tax=Streptomyces sp. NPDC058067 TaxID=3346324 RepID=UPI0036E811BF